MDGDEIANRDAQAFPSNESENFEPSDGLSKREYAAIEAMKGLLSNRASDVDGIVLVKAAVGLSDALFDELEKPKEK